MFLRFLITVRFAVIGRPLDKSYLKENSELQERLMQEHLALSQFPLGTRTQKYHFAERKLAMALISNASVIIEAGNSSGSLSLGWDALRLGRPLFVAKSVAENPTLKWPGEMLQYGALVPRCSPDRAFAKQLVDVAPF